MEKNFSTIKIKKEDMDIIDGNLYIAWMILINFNLMEMFLVKKDLMMLVI